MARQNRVSPFGEIVADPARGTLMGNRGGCFHNERQQLTHARWKGRRWIACRLEFRGRWRAVMQPNLYTELFFLDEATALAAGHRPCAQCRWSDFVRFKAAWLQANPQAGLESASSIDGIDAYLHRERVAGRQQKRTYRAALASIPAGAMVTLDRSTEQAYLMWKGRLFPWSFNGYAEPIAEPLDEEVIVLTPRSIVAAIAAGYAPAVHPSLGLDGHE
jgi:hypothetical protein